MAEANREEAEKCKQIARNALASGDADKATRFLTKAKRMCPEDSSIDALLQQAASGGGGASPGPGSASSEGPRQRPSAARPSATSSSGPSRVSKEGKTYTAEQMTTVQRILRTKDYYDLLEVNKGANADTIKKAYRKLSLKVHPDKNHAPGADEAFKKVSGAAQCLMNPEKKSVYDRYGDEEHIPRSQREAYQQDFVTPEDLFNAFFGGGFSHSTFHGNQAGRRNFHQHHDTGDAQAQRAQLFQVLPILLLILLTFASNLSSRDAQSRFSFSPSNQYRNERSTAALNVPYYVTDDFEDNYHEGTRTLAEFEKQVDIYYVRNLHSDCDYQEKLMYKKVLSAKRKGSQEELHAARNQPKPACKEMEKVKKKFPNIYRAAMYMGGY
eukprot:TRINITY_DN78640_c0_g1_i1.p1 TRINITY_DN78640_c0_g1~~TRINITY_DN78640_c0_g1_i1.p1  ORF type:complete len:383 (-),score=71.16 TRINITY_DN78640_c0_g1_i1:574-1722(-)